MTTTAYVSPQATQCYVRRAIVWGAGPAPIIVVVSAEDGPHIGFIDQERQHLGSLYKEECEIVTTVADAEVLIAAIRRRWAAEMTANGEDCVPDDIEAEGVSLLSYRPNSRRFWNAA